MISRLKTSARIKSNNTTLKVYMYSYILFTNEHHNLNIANFAVLVIVVH